MFLPRVVVSLALVATLASIVSCRSKPPPEERDASAAIPSADPTTETSSEPPGEAFVGDAGNRFRDAEPKVEVDPDGPVDPICSGAEISFATTVENPRCAIGSGRAKQLRAVLERDGGPPVTLKQEAKVSADNRVALRLVNTGTAPLTLPLSYSAKLPAFTVLAEDDRHTLYELEPPRLDVGSGDGGAGDGRPHFARIVLAPRAAAVATLTISPVVVRAMGRGAGSDKGGADGGDGGARAPATLAKGRYVLHIGELLTDVEAGAPARVTWDLP